MRNTSVFSILPVLLSLSFSQQALAVAPTLEAEIQIGNVTVSGLAVASQELSLDGLVSDTIPSTPERIRGLGYRLDLSAESGADPGVAMIDGVIVTVRNDNLEPLVVNVDVEALPSAAGADAFSNIQFQQACAALCTPVAYSLRLLPGEVMAAYNSALQSGGGLLSTLPRFESILASNDTLNGSAFFSGTTGKFDLANPNVRLSFAVLLATNGVWRATFDSNTTANASTAAAFGRLSIAVAAVPEPETYAMLLAGLGLVAWAGRRKKSHPKVA